MCASSIIVDYNLNKQGTTVASFRGSEECFEDKSFLNLEDKSQVVDFSVVSVTNPKIAEILVEPAATTSKQNVGVSVEWESNTFDVKKDHFIIFSLRIQYKIDLPINPDWMKWFNIQPVSTDVLQYVPTGILQTWITADDSRMAVAYFRAQMKVLKDSVRVPVQFLLQAKGGEEEDVTHATMIFSLGLTVENWAMDRTRENPPPNDWVLI